MSVSRVRVPLGVAIGVAVAAYPFIVNSPPTWQLWVQICYYLLVVLSWNVVSGYAGLFSFGHVAFVALGAYGTAILAAREQLPLPLAMVFGTLIAGLVGSLLGMLSVRIRGPYLVVVSFAFLAFVQVFLNAQTGLTGGASGMSMKSLFLLSQPSRSYILGLILVAVFLLGQLALLHSHWRDYLVAIRDNEFVAGALGGHPRRWKITTFAATAAVAGLAGAFYGQFIGFITPDMGGVGEMSFVVAIGMIGGLGSVWGPVISTIGLLVIDDHLRATTAGFSPFLFGAVLLLVVVFFPGGLSRVGDALAGLIRSVKAKRRGEAVGAGTEVEDVAPADVAESA